MRLMWMYAGMLCAVVWMVSGCVDDYVQCSDDLDCASGSVCVEAQCVLRSAAPTSNGMTSTSGGTSTSGTTIGGGTTGGTTGSGGTTTGGGGTTGGGITTGGTTGSGGTTSGGTTGGGTTGGSTSTPSPIQRCLDTCEAIVSCPEVSELCNARGIEGLLSTCNRDFCGDPEIIDLLLALEEVPCATVVPLVFGQLPQDVLEQCFEDVPDVVDAVGSRITRLDVLGDSSLGFDLDGDSTPDNVLGNLLEQISSLLADSDPNAAVNLLLESGELGLALNWTGLEGQQLDQAIDGSPLNGYRLDGIGPEGSYFVSSDSFVNGRPRYGMASVQVFDRVAEASGGTLPVYLGFGAGIVFPATLIGAQVQALLEPTEVGIRVLEGQLGGAVPLDEVMAGLNSFLRSERCSCLGLDEDLIQIGAGGYVCQEPSTSGSCRGEAELCSVIASACTLAIPIITGQADQTLSNGLPALSVFIAFEAEGARLRLP